MDTKFRQVKNEVRIIGWDDAPFSFDQKTVALFGVIFRGGSWMDGLLTTKITVDGLDATEKITESIKRTRHNAQLRVIMLDGVTFGGFNIVDIQELNKKTKLPVIVINRKRPDFAKIEDALKHFKDYKERWKRIKAAGEVCPCTVKSSEIYYQSAGIKNEDALKIIRLSTTRSLLPEPLRIAHLIASGVTCGESYGRA